MDDIITKMDYFTKGDIVREIKTAGTVRCARPSSYQPRVSHRSDSAIAAQDQIDICLNCTKAKCYGYCNKIRGMKVRAKKK